MVILLGAVVVSPSLIEMNICQVISSIGDGVCDVWVLFFHSLVPLSLQCKLNHVKVPGTWNIHEINKNHFCYWTNKGRNLLWIELCYLSMLWSVVYFDQLWSKYFFAVFRYFVFFSIHFILFCRKEDKRCFNSRLTLHWLIVHNWLRAVFQIEDLDPYLQTQGGQTRHARGPVQLPRLWHIFSLCVYSSCSAYPPTEHSSLVPKWQVVI